MKNFTCDCFIRLNTPELRDYLKDIGHNFCSCCTFDGWDWLHINTDCEGYTVRGIAQKDEFGAFYL